MEIIHDVDQPRQETRTCRICNEVGHLARNCPQAPPREETRFFIALSEFFEQLSSAWYMSWL